MSSESDSARPEIVAFQELSLLVRHMEDELASFRKRALAAESRIKELEALSGDEPADVVALARENADLKKRLDAATVRTRQLLERVRFVRQQGGKGGEK